MKDSAAARHRRLDRAIELKAFEIKCAEAIAGQWAEGSDRGWVLSILVGTVGTALAVTRGRTARQWGNRVTTMRAELAELRVERRLLDRLG